MFSSFSLTNNPQRDSARQEKTVTNKLTLPENFFACTIAGAASDILSNCSGATRAARTSQGMLLLFMALLSVGVVGLSMAYGWGHWGAGVIAAVLWLPIYVSLDRSIFASMDGIKKGWGGLAVRILMNAGLAVVIGHWAAVAFLQSDIVAHLEQVREGELQALHLQFAETAAERRASIDAQREILDEREAELAAQETALVEATGDLPRAQGRLNQARQGIEARQAQVAALQADVSKQQKWLRMEVAGEPKSEDCPTCTGIAGDGPAAKSKRAGLNAASARLDEEAASLQARLDAIVEEEANLQQAAAAKTAATAGLERQKTALAREQAEFEETLKSGPEAVLYEQKRSTYQKRVAELENRHFGLVDQSWALWQLEKKEPFVVWSWLLIVFLLELAPTLVKAFLKADEYDVFVDKLRYQPVLDHAAHKQATAREAELAAETREAKAENAARADQAESNATLEEILLESHRRAHPAREERIRQLADQAASSRAETEHLKTLIENENELKQNRSRLEKLRRWNGLRAV